MRPTQTALVAKTLREAARALMPIRAAKTRVTFKKGDEDEHDVFVDGVKIGALTKSHKPRGGGSSRAMSKRFEAYWSFEADDPGASAEFTGANSLRLGSLADGKAHFRDLDDERLDDYKARLPFKRAINAAVGSNIGRRVTLTSTRWKGLSGVVVAESGSVVTIRFQARGFTETYDFLDSEISYS